MKYVITGGSGNISKPLSLKLIRDGHEVTVIARNEEHLGELKSAGAKPAIGDLGDVEFLKRTFQGADAVYTMIPPNPQTKDFRSFQKKLAGNFEQALAQAKTKFVVNLSSVGADATEGTGPVTELHHFESRLNKIQGLNVKHLRPGYFMHNFMAQIGMIKGMGVMGGNMPEDMTIILVHPQDIAAAAAEELEKLNFSGNSVRYIVGEAIKLKDVARILGTAIGKAELPWVFVTDEQFQGGLQQAGLTEDMAGLYVEMGKAFREGKMTDDFFRQAPAQSPTKLETFSKEFAQAFSA